MTKRLVCPVCEQGDELHLLEDIRVERKLGEVTDEHIEYLDIIPDSHFDFREVGVVCGNCGFLCDTGFWKEALKGVVNEAS